MSNHNERGIALVLALFLMSALSVLSASLMFLSQTETYASMNYRMMSQARYGAEAGVQKAANFLLDSTQYSAPSGAGDPLWNPNVSPVTYGNQPVVLSATSSVASNYPSATVRTAFNTAAQGSLTAGNQTIQYGAYATLLSMQQFNSYGGGSSVVQMWQINGTGGVNGARTATVEVVATIETPKIPASTYGAFATDNTCGALTFGGNSTIDSYDSTNTTGTTAPTTTASGGNVGTNGNLTISGSVAVQGNLYTPRTGVGACTQGAVTAASLSGRANVAGSIVQLPTSVTYPTPQVPAQSSLPAVSISSLSAGTAAATCSSLGLVLGTNCSVDATNNIITIDGHGSALTLPSVSVSSAIAITLVGNTPAGQYNFNSISLTGQSTLNVKVTSNVQAAVVNVVGKNPDGTTIATPLDFSGGTFASPDISACSTCSRYDASLLQILYAGTGNINLTGNSAAAATIYAPNASATISGTADIYGSILTKRLNNTGNANIHYDRRLQRGFYVAGNPLASSFTWKRY